MLFIQTLVLPAVILTRFGGASGASPVSVTCDIASLTNSTSTKSPSKHINMTLTDIVNFDDVKDNDMIDTAYIMALEECFAANPESVKYALKDMAALLTEIINSDDVKDNDMIDQEYVAALSKYFAETQKHIIA